MNSVRVVGIFTFMSATIILSGCEGGLFTFPPASTSGGITKSTKFTPKPPSITLTPAAVHAIRAIPEDKFEAESLHLHVGVAAGGCEGYVHQLGLRTEAAEDEHVNASNGIRIVTRKRHALMLDGTTIDFVEESGRRGFTFDNPNFEGEAKKNWVAVLEKEREQEESAE